MDENNEKLIFDNAIVDIMKSIFNAKPREHNLVLEFNRLNKEFIDFANKENAMQEEAKQILKMQDVCKKIELLESFPFIYGKQIGAVGGGFSAGKSSFLNTFIQDKSVELTVGITPITIIPCYITCENNSAITGYTKNGGCFSIDPETFRKISHESLESIDFDLKEHLPYITLSSPLDKQLFNNICFIDTPGYNSAGIGSEQSDAETAAEYILKADFLIWLIDIQRGCIPQSDIQFLNELAQKKDFEFYIVINKAETKPEKEREAVFNKIQEDVEDRLDLKCAGISLYSSSEEREYSFKDKSVIDFIKSHNNFVENKTYMEIETEIDEVLNDYIEALNNQKREYEKNTKAAAAIKEIEGHLQTVKELKGKFKKNIILKLNEKAAEHGHAGAQCKLGNMYFYGEGVEKDYQKAMEWYEEAAKQGNADAQFKLGYMYFYGEGVVQAYVKAFYWFEKAAMQDNAAAQYSLGLMHYEAKGIPQDYETAVYLFGKSAEQGYDKAKLYLKIIRLEREAERGNAAAQYDLGLIYYKGQEIERDFQKAFWLFEKAVSQGHSGAQYNLGLMHYKGQVVKQDFQIAFLWFERAAEQGDISAQYILGLMYDKGEGVKKDSKKAIYYFENAAEHGDPEAQYELGARVSDDEKSKYWYEKSAKQGNPKAMFELGAMYEFGVGGSVDNEVAQYWFKESKAGLEKLSNQNDMKGQLALALLFSIERDYEKTKYWLERSAESGNADLQQMLLVIMYCVGKDNAGEFEQAMRKEAKTSEKMRLMAIWRKLVGCYLQDYEKAKYWLEKAAKSGNADLQKILLLMYCVGKDNAREFEQEMKEAGSPWFGKLANYYLQDYEKAKYWLEKAAESGDADLQQMLLVMYCIGKDNARKFEQQMREAGTPWFGKLANYYLQDYEKAKYWLEKAAESGNGDAQQMLALIYYDSSDFKKRMKAGNVLWFVKLADYYSQNYEKAFYWYTRAADHGDAEAQYKLGVMYYQGEGVKQDYQKAFFWFEKAAVQGNAEVQALLGVLYVTGEGGDNQDYQKAFSWFEKAAQQGNVDAQAMLGNMYFAGDGVSKDKQKAKEWYKKAADQGDEDAKKKLSSL
jgi:TPR repeat protein